MTSEKEEAEIYEIVEQYLIDNVQQSTALVEEIKAWKEKYSVSSKVKEFMLTGGQPVHEYPTNENKERAILRLSLILEELGELAEGLKQVEEFKSLMRAMLFKDNLKNHTKDNMKTTLDALADLQYVLTGAVHEFGFGKFINDAFNEVHKSNMSKFCKTEEESLATLEKYELSGIACVVKSIGKYYVVFRASDMKILKSVNYVEPNLIKVLNN